MPQDDAPDTSSRGPILVAIDGSEPAMNAAEQAVLLARALGATMYFLNVIDPSELFHAGIHRQEVKDRAVRTGTEVTAKAAALAEQHGVEHEEVIAEGPPARVILTTVEDIGARYVFMGTEGMSRVARAIIGSVSEEVLRSAEATTVVLVGGGRQPDER